MKIQRVVLNDVWNLRHKVMWPNKPFDYIKIDNDDDGIHYGVLIEDKLLSTISLFINNGEAQFRKFATLKEEQGKGYGTKLLQYIMEEAERLNIKRIWCNARIEKVYFYKKFGLEKTDQRFFRGNQEYVIMQKNIDSFNE